MMPHALDRLEPEAAETWKRIIDSRGDAMLVGTEEEHCLATLSIAISAKRIADALSGLDFSSFSIIDNQLQTLAWNAGRSFEAGRRQ